MSRLFWIVAIGIFISCSEDNLPVGEGPMAPQDTPDNIAEYPGYTLVWNDEFIDLEIDASKWGFETGDGTDFGLPPGWGNNELQIYTDQKKNAEIIQDGDLSVLSITANREGDGYNSAKLTTEQKASFRFGKIDVRAKMPEGQGIWPAIWMLGDNRDQIDWPGTGEIDLVEVLGHKPSRYYSTLHYTNADNSKGEKQQTHQLSDGSLSESYHLYTLDWDHEALTFSLDSSVLSTILIEEDMKEFLRSFYLILNVAVGGYWPGNPDNTTTFPQSMFIDFIRVYSRDDYTPPTEPPLDIEEETLGGVLEENFAYNGIQSGFNYLGLVDIITFGSGGQPDIQNSESAIDGNTSLAYVFPGGSWGGAWFEMEHQKDFNSFSSLRFSLSLPDSLHTAEIKLESPKSNAAIFLVDYTPIELGNDFVEYKIPLEDFEGLNLSEVHIPFAFWNPQDINGDYIQGTVLIDNVYFE